MFVVLKWVVVPEEVSQIEGAEINSLRGFILRGKMVEYHIFQGNRPIGEWAIMCSQKEESSSDKQQIDAIISSIKPQEKPLKSAREDFEKAKLFFASALLLDWQSSQYHYYLGQAFLRQKIGNQQRNTLTKQSPFNPIILRHKNFLIRLKVS